MKIRDVRTFFQFCCDNWISQLIYDLYSEMDEKFRIATDAEIKNLDKVFQNAEDYFIERLKMFCSDYYHENIDEQEPDIHKYCAIICRTLIHEKTIKFDMLSCETYIKENNISPDNTDWLVKNALVNYRIAFYASVVLLYQSMLMKYTDPIIQDKLRKNKNLNLYTKKDGTPKSINHESFENYIIIDLAKRDVNNKSFEFFMYAALMYQLEEYNRMFFKDIDQ